MGTTSYLSCSGTKNISLKNVLLHEIGHALGMGHEISGNVMDYYPSTRTSLGDEDIKTITSVYDLAYFMVFGENYSSTIVSKVFTGFLGRSPTSTELTTYKTKLIYNRLPSKRNYDYRQFVIDIASSSGMWSKYKSTNSLYIPAVYKALLGRSPNATELHIGDSLMKAGTARLLFVKKIAQSQEWSERYVATVYKEQLNRIISGSTLTNIATAITNNTSTAWDVLRNTVRSQTYFSLCSPQTNAGYINRTFSTLLGYAPSSSWYSYLLDRID